MTLNEQPLERNNIHLLTIWTCFWLLINIRIFSSSKVHTFLCSTTSITQSIEQLEKEMLNGQKLQGPATAADVHLILEHKNLVDK